MVARRLGVNISATGRFWAFCTVSDFQRLRIMLDTNSGVGILRLAVGARGTRKGRTGEKGSVVRFHRGRAAVSGVDASHGLMKPKGDTNPSH